MFYLYNLILYRPLLNSLVFIYNILPLHDLGVAIVLLTILIRLILFPLFHKSARHQAKLQKIQPHLKKINETHKNDAEKKVQATMALYREHEINPFAPFLLLLIQLPILIALYQIFSDILHPDILNSLYPWVHPPADLNPTFLGLINLGKSSMVVAVLVALAQFAQMGLSFTAPAGSKTRTEKITQRATVYLIPIFLFLFVFTNLPAAVNLYWLTTTLFSAGQQIIINREIHGKLEPVSKTTN